MLCGENPPPPGGRGGEGGHAGEVVRRGCLSGEDGGGREVR